MTQYLAPQRDEEPEVQLADIVAGPSPSRRGFNLVALWTGLLAMVGGVVFAVGFLAQSGAGSPEEAVQQLFEAISEEDVLGVLDALPPSERDPLMRVQDVAKELGRLGVLSSDFALDGVKGVDLAFDNLRLSSMKLGEDVSAVRVEGGTARWRVVPQQLPLGDVVRDLLGDELGSEPESGSDEITTRDEVELVTIEEGGRWYVSIWYSVAESIRKETREPAPVFGSGLTARGSDSPERAVRELVDAATRLDARRVIELLPPDEARALHDYAPLFLDDAESAAEDAREGFEVHVDELELASKRDGDEAVVTVRSLALSGVVWGAEFAYRFDGRCMDARFGDESHRTCPEDLGKTFSFLSALPLPHTADSAGVVVVRRDGAWYVSPTRSVLHGVVGTLRALDRDHVKAIAQELKGFMGEDVSDDEIDNEIYVDPEEPPLRQPTAPSLGGYSPREFQQLPPEQQERILREEQRGKAARYAA